MAQRHQIVLETMATRERAEALLRTLLECKARSERNLAELRHTDVFKSVTGRSALENAISTTQRMVDALERVIAHARRDMSEDDLSLLEGVEGLEGDGGGS